MPLIDHYDVTFSGLESPASNGLTILPSNDNDLPVKPRALMVNTTGNVRMQLGDAVITLALQEGAPYPIRPTRIFATGTTATGIVLLW